MAKRKRIKRSKALEVDMKINLKDYKPNEFGLGTLFADTHGDTVKYLTKQKMYRIWNQEKGVWVCDESEQINEIVKEFIMEEMPMLIKKTEDNNVRKSFETLIKHRDNMASVSSILKCARSRPNMTATTDDFDIYDNLLNLKNGVLNLDTCDFLKHNKEYMMTKTMNVLFDKDAEDRTWNKFLQVLSNQDKDWCKYLLRTIAYMLRGNPTDHCMFIWYGPRARNGKTTFSKALLHIFNNYGTTLPPNTLAKSKNRIGDKPNPDIIRLVGERFVNIPETDKEYHLNSALIKSLTGGDAMAIRDLYSSYQDFENKGVFVLHSNHLPKVDDDTIFTSGRIVVIPFEHFLEENERDPQMFQKLTTEKAKSSLLNLLIKAVKKNKQYGIKTNQPKRVIAETQKYINQADTIEWFIKENIAKKYGEWIKTELLVSRYDNWAKENRLASISTNALTSALKLRGFRGHRKNIGIGFKDIILKK